MQARAFKVLILSSRGGERQHGLRGHRPVRSGNGPIVQPTQARNGAVPHPAHPMPDRPSVPAVFFVGHITHPLSPLKGGIRRQCVNRFRSTAPLGRSVGRTISTEGWHVTEDADGPPRHGTARAAPDSDPRPARAAAPTPRSGPPGDERPLGRERQRSGAGAAGIARAAPLVDAWKAGIAAPAHHTADPTAAGATGGPSACVRRRPALRDARARDRRTAGARTRCHPAARGLLRVSIRSRGTGLPVATPLNPPLKCRVFVMPHSEAAAIRMAVHGPCQDFLARVLGSTA